MIIHLTKLIINDNYEFKIVELEDCNYLMYQTFFILNDYLT